MTKNGDLNFNHRSLASAGDQDPIDIYFSHHPKAGNKYETIASHPCPILTCLVDSLSYLKAPLLLSFAPPANSYAETPSSLASQKNKKWPPSNRYSIE